MAWEAELQGSHSQAGAWERAQTVVKLFICIHPKSQTVKNSSLIAAFLLFLAVPCFADSLENTIKGAKQGDATAQYLLGQRFARGQEVPRDDAEAVKWWSKGKRSLPPAFSWERGHLGRHFSGRDARAPRGE
ncbi:MAG: hypothetical protein WCI11_02875 [Candidatus Methylumidiphilus sp.]